MPLVLQLHLVMINKYSKFGVDTLNTFWVMGYINVFVRRGQRRRWSSDHNSSTFSFKQTSWNEYINMGHFSKKNGLVFPKLCLKIAEISYIRLPNSVKMTLLLSFPFFLKKKRSKMTSKSLQTRKIYKNIRQKFSVFMRFEFMVYTTGTNIFVNVDSIFHLFSIIG